ncbi:MAG: hypothetical protein AAF604_01580 [Acidobacteriota bacterium]
MFHGIHDDRPGGAFARLGCFAGFSWLALLLIIIGGWLASSPASPTSAEGSAVLSEALSGSTEPGCALQTPRFESEPSG